MRPMVAFVMALSLGTPTVAWAEGCGRTATQFDLDRCAGSDFKRADDALNAVYRKIMDRLNGDAPTRTLLIGAQKAWLVFRDAECAFATSGTTGGSIHPMVVASCRARATEARFKALRGYLDCQEGDTSCPVPSR